MGGGMPGTDRLWVPLLSHYGRSGGGVAIDADRMAAHLSFIRPSVRQFLIAGSTGDGWELDQDTLLALLDLTRRDGLFSGTRILFGALRADTPGVVETARAVERSLREKGPTAAEFRGFAVCPPIDPGAGQDAILAHYQAVIAATESPIAVYQLPQVTGCSIAPETMRVLAANPRVTMFKDTSGTDTVATAGVEGVTLVRGAEGRYAEMLKPAGPYDGWLLSTGNSLGPQLRRMLDLLEAGRAADAARLSGVMTAVVDALFDAARDLPFGNPFSNANRAVDHLWAHGRAWRDAAPPLTASGNTLPEPFLEAVADIVGRFPSLPDRGYLAGA